MTFSSSLYDFLRFPAALFWTLFILAIPFAHDTAWQVANTGEKKTQLSILLN